MASQTQTHVFELAGLGAAPYRYAGLQTAADRAAFNAERRSAGATYTTNNATSCDYCGTAIQNAHYLESADGHTFKVGCDCIRKSGDEGMVDAAKLAQKQRKSAEREQKRQDEREAKLQEQRERNGGLTDYELRQREAEKHAAAVAKQAEQENAFIFNVLGYGFWGSEDLRTTPVSHKPDRFIAVIADQYAKAHGRRNSKAYNAAYDEFYERIDVAAD